VGLAWSVNALAARGGGSYYGLTSHPAIGRSDQ